MDKENLFTLRKTKGNTERPFDWRTIISVGTLAVSLLGNWTQYKNLEIKKAELAQAQSSLEMAERKDSNRRSAQFNKRRDLEARMTKLDEAIIQADDDLQVAFGGMAYGKDKLFAAAQIKDAEEQKKALIQQKNALQEKIDALPVE